MPIENIVQLLAQVSPNDLADMKIRLERFQQKMANQSVTGKEMLERLQAEGLPPKVAAVFQAIREYDSEMRVRIQADQINKAREKNTREGKSYEGKTPQEIEQAEKALVAKASNFGMQETTQTWLQEATASGAASISPDVLATMSVIAENLQVFTVDKERGGEYIAQVAQWEALLTAGYDKYVSKKADVMQHESESLEPYEKELAQLTQARGPLGIASSIAMANMTSLEEIANKPEQLQKQIDDNTKNIDNFKKSKAENPNKAKYYDEEIARATKKIAEAQHALPDAVKAAPAAREQLPQARADYEAKAKTVKEFDTTIKTEKTRIEGAITQIKTNAANQTKPLDAPVDSARKKLMETVDTKVAEKTTQAAANKENRKSIRFTADEVQAGEKPAVSAAKEEKRKSLMHEGPSASSSALMAKSMQHAPASEPTIAATPNKSLQNSTLKRVNFGTFAGPEIVNENKSAPKAEAPVPSSTIRKGVK